MTASFPLKASTLLQAIATTVALAMISGHLTLHLPRHSPADVQSSNSSPFHP
ncbi:hypothetical protein [Neosynechococcus sphagnicola]|uniref:hypothetical protein n=1 Tax=Neosynechococcus sphagnicola TaxID=1501145 RepID=UPI0012DFEAF7|nr:hypothetical protein [Neosynechococcus sphagnicola]